VGAHGHGGVGQRQGKQGQFVDDDAPWKRLRGQARTGGSGLRAAEPPQGPIIEQQEQGWNRHQHRLGHQTQDEKPDHGKVAAQRARMADILGVGPSVSMKNKPLRTSRRDEIHTTGSTCRGWSVNNAATSALGHSGRSFATGPETAPTSPRCAAEGCQVVSGWLQAVKLAVEHVGEHRERIPLASGPLVKVQAIPDHVRPPETCGSL